MCVWELQCLGLNPILTPSLDFPFLNYRQSFVLVFFISGNDSSVYFSKSFSSGFYRWKTTLFHSIDRKKTCKRNTSICFLMTSYILWVYYWNILEASWITGNVKNLIIAIVKWAMNCIPQAGHDMGRVESYLVVSAHLLFFFRCFMTLLIKQKIGRTWLLALMSSSMKSLSFRLGNGIQRSG